MCNYLNYAFFFKAKKHALRKKNLQGAVQLWAVRKPGEPVSPAGSEQFVVNVLSGCDVFHHDMS